MAILPNFFNQLMIELLPNKILSLFFMHVKQGDLLHSKYIGEAIKVLLEVGLDTYDLEEFLKIILLTNHLMRNMRLFKSQVNKSSILLQLMIIVHKLVLAS